MTRSPHRYMFWRLWWRAISVKRPQAALALGSLLVGAAITSMLLTLYSGVRRKMTEDFRAYGANVLIAPPAAQTSDRTASSVLAESMLQPLTQFIRVRPATVAVPVLYGVVQVSREHADPRLPEFENAVAAGADFHALRGLNSGWRLTGEADLAPRGCAAGRHLAARLHAQVGDTLMIQPAGEAGHSRPSPASCRLATLLTTGASEDDQIFLPLVELQNLLATKGKISLVEVSIPGDTREVEANVHRVANLLPGLDVRPIRQIVYSEGKVLGTVRWMLLSLTVLILVIISLCVMATLTAIVLERRKDVGVMKALGATNTRLMWLFVVEGAGLGFAGGVAGFYLGAVLARGVGLRLFGVTLNVSPWTLPLVCGLTVGLAVLAAQVPVRLVLAIQPASVLKGE